MDDQELARFMAKVQVQPNGCWTWTGKRGTNGYGYFWLNGKNRLAHRVAYEHFIAMLNDGDQVDHTCHGHSGCHGLGNKCPHRPCVNPNDLEAVSSRENVLRSTGLAAVNIKKVYCPAGHEFTPGNTYVYPDGRERACRICRAKAQRDWRNKHHPERGLANADKTHCLNGHPFSAENTRINSAGRRICITCYREKDREKKKLLRRAKKEQSTNP